MSKSQYIEESNGQLNKIKGKSGRTTTSDIFVTRFDSIHLLTGYEGNSTFIVPKVPTIFRGKKYYYLNIKSISVLLY